MAGLHYEVVEHDGGWAYRLNGAISETFQTRDAAHAAAELAAGRQHRPDSEDRVISYEDEDGRWRQEVSAASDRPEVDVED